jgi:hypothetical protein
MRLTVARLKPDIINALPILDLACYTKAREQGIRFILVFARIRVISTAHSIDQPGRE